MDEPINAAAMSPEQKLQFIEDQILQIRAGDLKWMLCPYCGGENERMNEFVCCKTFGDASMAILDRMEKQDTMDFMANINDKAMDIATKKFIN